MNHLCKYVLESHKPYILSEKNVLRLQFVLPFTWSLLQLRNIALYIWKRHSYLNKSA